MEFFFNELLKCLLVIRLCYVKCNVNEEKYKILNDLFYCVNVILNGFLGVFFNVLVIY